uniref:Uncharacterized protein n=1 Tax=Mustela putorius furo TaxID=9669 RepID=M3YYY2_MUSPF
LCKFHEATALGSRKAQENQRGRKRAGRHRLQRPPPPPHLSPLKTTTTKPLRRIRSKCRFPQLPKPFRGSGARLPRSLLAPTAPTPPPRLLCTVLERLSEVPPAEVSLRHRPSICNSKPSDCRGVIQGVPSFIREGAAGSAWRCGGQWLKASGRERRTGSCPGPPCPV